MRKLAFSLVMALVAGACGFGPPASTATLNVADKATEVAIDKVLEFDFSGPVDAGVAEGKISFSPVIDGTYTLLPGGKALTFEPLAWAEGTTYRVRLDPFSDLAGRPVSARQWTFTTTVVPRVESLHDDAGDGLGPGLTVEQGGKVTVVFSTPMSQPDTAFTVNDKPASPAWSADSLSAAISTAGLPIGALTLALTQGKDLHNHSVAPFSVTLDVSYVVHIETTHLPYPALVQIPNDGYGARPQVGIQAAAMVFEYQTEGSIQRTTALFTDVPAVIGPTRSARRISLRLDRHYHSELFLSGMSNDLHSFLNANLVPTIWDNPPGFYRDYGRAAPNNLMLRGDYVLSAEQQAGLPAYAPLVYGTPDLGANPGPGTQFTVDEHRSAYSYDPTTGTYTKVEDGDTMTDASLNKPDQIFMVLVVHAPEFLVSDIESGCCTRGRDFNLDGGGALDIFYRGEHAVGSWSSPDPSSPLVFKNAAGTVLSLPHGLVWVDVVGN